MDLFNYDPEQEFEFYQLEGFNSCEEYYQHLDKIEADERKEKYTIEVDIYEYDFLIIACQEIADKWHKRNEIVVPYDGDITPTYIKGMYSLALKLGVKLVNKYCDLEYIEWKKKSGFFDHYPIQFYTEEEMKQIENEIKANLEQKEDNSTSNNELLPVEILDDIIKQLKTLEGC